ncbi:MAG: Nif3-like dinuclear metal center hexameric protein, partial [Pseudomonadota bacterium]
MIAPFESWAPLHLAEGYDNTGLMVGRPDTPCTGVLFSLDCTEAVVAEAAEKGCNLIISHHPIWFGARKRLNGTDYVSRTILAAIQQGIALYAIHTNLDNVPTGVNHALAKRIGLAGTRILAPRAADQPQAGAGLIGKLPRPHTPTEWLDLLAHTFGSPAIRYTLPSGTTRLETVAVCGGAGSFLIEAAREAGAHALITADITYHRFFDHEDRLMILDIG